VVLGDPHRLIAEPFGGEHLLEGGLVDGLLGPGLVALHQKEQAEIHSYPSGSVGDPAQDTSGRHRTIAHCQRAISGTPRRCHRLRP
jgi:hypothetical protein